jgi:hypothetical protein
MVCEWYNGAIGDASVATELDDVFPVVPRARFYAPSAVTVHGCNSDTLTATVDALAVLAPHVTPLDTGLDSVAITTAVTVSTNEVFALDGSVGVSAPPPPLTTARPPGSGSSDGLDQEYVDVIVVLVVALVCVLFVWCVIEYCKGTDRGTELKY